MGDDQEFSIEVDTADFIKSMAVKGSEENEIFLDFQKLHGYPAESRRIVLPPS